MALQADLVQVVQQLSLRHDLEGVMAVLRDAARRLTGADGVTVVLRDGDLCHYADESAIAPLWKGRRFPMETCISGWCMLNKSQVAIADIYEDSRIPHDAYRPTFVRSLAMTPIRRVDPVGAIGAYWASEHHATPEELELLQALGDAASTALANVQLFGALEEASRRKDEFLAMLAHELRNPLAPMRNAAHVLRSSPDDGAATGRAHEMLDRQLRHLQRIVDDLLEVSRVTRGRIELRLERLDLAGLLVQAADDHRAALEDAGITFEVDVPDVPVWVRGDPTRLALAAGNVLDNARRFTPAGGRVSVRLAADPGDAVVSVADTGVGIEADMLPRVFEVFAQADRSLDRTGGGLGLGLPLARGVLELHGGTIEVASPGSGHGTTVLLRLPREPEPAALASSPVVHVDGGQARVLVVEDNRDAADSLRMVLELSGYQVAVAHTGPDGLERARALRPEIVLCDIGLPGMDGYAVAETLRGDPTTSAARLVAVTGYGSESDRRRALDAGFELHLVKPVQPDRLLRHLAEMTAAV